MCSISEVPMPKASAPRTVRGRVAVAADHGHTRAYEPLLVHEHVLDALRRVVGAVEGLDAEVAAVLFQVRGLKGAGRVVNHTRGDVRRRNDVVDHTQVRFGRKDAAAALAHVTEGLRTRAFVDKVGVHVQKHRVLVDPLDRVGVHDPLV